MQTIRKNGIGEQEINKNGYQTLKKIFFGLSQKYLFNIIINADENIR